MVDRAADSGKSNASFFPNRRGARLLIHETPTAGTASAAAIICPPFGEEKQKSYRVHYHLAGILANAGVSCYRFDYGGCGDSDGDYIDTTIDSMVGDTCDVIDYVHGKADTKRIYVIGTRLGATVAALVGEQKPELTGLGLLFPVINGSRYWNDVLRQQQMADLSAGLKPAPRSRLAEHLQEHGFVEIESNRVSSEMVRQFSDLNLSESTPQIRCPVFGSSFESDKKGQSELADLLAQFRDLECDTEQFVSGDDEYWTLHAMYSNYVPSETLERLVGWIGR